MSDTKIMPTAGARGGRRRSVARDLARDFAIIIGVWAVTAPLILWLTARVVGPALFGGSTP